ncbi:shikimate dehydrogenase family protein [Novosphingopyxis baekryungensis]|uniref:shikimate dehydrogenase family protein n=1 Tax=Novosphingopyxis baekryungensis TaxID=279369 RepID=UPI0003B48B66|nr:shikimate dehydrogenase [Novosphingopyxis baekryungensis]
MKQITGQPYAEVIGNPVKHSKSPLIHRFWLNRLGIDADYRIAEISADGLADYFAERREDPDWMGCNITIPHKIAALDHVADPGGVRDTIGAINTVFRGEDGLLTGTNTDAAGFWAPIAERNWSGRHAIVIGSGGAARAVLFALARGGIGEVTMVARNPLKAMGLLAHFGLKGGVQAMDVKLPAAHLLINASPLGMSGQEPLALDLEPLKRGALVYDLVYKPVETALLRQAEDRELEVVDGLSMLVAQAAFAFELFFGEAAPEEGQEALFEKLTA